MCRIKCGTDFLCRTLLSQRKHTIANLDNVVENTTAAESAIRDTDMATQMVTYSNNQILAQYSTFPAVPPLLPFSK